jgi:hypothetical protein
MLPRLPRLERICAQLLLVLAGVGWLAGCGSGSSASRPHLRGNLESIFEAEPQLHADPAGTLAQVRQLGASRMRVYVPWSSFAPAPTSRTRPASFNASDPASYPAGAWSIYDAIARAAARQGVGLDFTIGGPPPLWASGPGAPPGGRYPEWMPSASAFGAFVRAIAVRYSGHYTPRNAANPLPRITFWSIWNEPNYGPELAPQATNHSTVEVAPRLYRDLLDAAWASLQASGHRRDTILIGETAPRGLTTGNSPGNFSGMVPLRFLRALYCLDQDYRPLRGAAATTRGCPTAGAQFTRLHPALFNANGFADHPYPQGLPPNVATPQEPDYADLAVLSRLEGALDRSQQAYGSHVRMPIYDTEYGYQTNPPEKIVRSIDPKTAALYLNWAEYMHWRDARVRSYDQYQLRDPPTASATGGFATGLEFKDGTQKATYDAFRMPLFLPVSSAPAGKALEVWGAVRPAPYARRSSGRQQRVLIEFRPTGTGAFRPLRTLPLTDPHGYFDVDVNLPSSGEVRLSWSYPSGATIHSRSASVAIH